MLRRLSIRGIMVMGEVVAEELESFKCSEGELC